MTARGATIWEAFASWNIGRVRLLATLDKLFDAAWNEAQFATTSRLRHEAAPVTELHFTPGSPRAVKLGLEYRF